MVIDSFLAKSSISFISSAVILRDSLKFLGLSVGLPIFFCSTLITSFPLPYIKYCDTLLVVQGCGKYHPCILFLP
nr:MAG TPA: hypothetical protein [Caudoviricetes sp.]